MGKDLLADIAAVMRADETLLVLPCSAQKSTTGTTSGSTSGGVLDALPDELAADLRRVRAINAAPARVVEDRLAPALDRYTGTLYQALGAEARDRLATGPALILSGRYGSSSRSSRSAGTISASSPEGGPTVCCPGSWPPTSEGVAVRPSSRCSAPPAPTSRSCGGAMIKTPRALGEALQAACTGALADGLRSSDGVALPPTPLR